MDQTATSIAQNARALPIYEKHAEIVSAIGQNQVIVIAGETGSGKTTQLPFFCIEAGRGKFGKIGCTQPRRIAATSIAARVAAQMGCDVGATVGYKIRFAAKESAQTVVKFMTDGILLAETETDHDLTKYDTIIIDEAHERSLNIDFLLGYLRKLLLKRPDLKLIISSATIDAKRFSESFGGAPIIEVSGRLYPIEVLYRTPRNDDDETESVGYVEDAVAAVNDLLDAYGGGDMLVFMPTERDIRETCDKLGDLARRRDLAVLPLFSRMASGEQNAIFNPGEKTRIVVCTNIAETSITVPNIRFVVDTGLARILRYAPRLRTNRLPIEPISRASADQRKGRCGRVRDGVCVRLYSEAEFNARDPFTTPEIKRSNLAGVILTMTAHNLGAIEEFPFIESPSKQSISEGYAQLKELGALDKSKKLTPLGREMSKLPFDPHISRMIIAAQKEGALSEVKIIAAALSIVDPRERPLDKQNEADIVHKKFLHKDSDFLTFLNIWDAYHKEWAAVGTHGGMRRFCIENFLSYTRMREWLDVYMQLDGVLRGDVSNNENLNNSNNNVLNNNVLKSNNANQFAGDKGAPPPRNAPPRGYTVGSNVNVNVNSNVNVNVNSTVNTTVNTTVNNTNVNVNNVNVNNTNVNNTNDNSTVIQRQVVDNKNVAESGGRVVPRRIIRRSDVLAGRVAPPPRPVYNNVPPNNNFAPNNGMMNNNVMPNNNFAPNNNGMMNNGVMPNNNFAPNNNYVNNRPPYNNYQNNYASNRQPYNNNYTNNRPPYNNNYQNNYANNRPPYNNNYQNNYATNRPQYNNNYMNNRAPYNNNYTNNRPTYNTYNNNAANAAPNNVMQNNNFATNRPTYNNAATIVRHTIIITS